MRLTRRIVLPTGLEICLGARPLPPDHAEAAPDDGRDDARDSAPEAALNRTAPPRID